ncbi:MAG: methyltransferase domain-containing protein [Candidatus Obscuribacterales bacterium]|jgi:SAM-dependent methyltransferase
MSNTKQPAWWQSFYDDTPFELYMVRSNQAEMEESIAFLREKLHLTAGATIFDQCCGFGAMSIPLAERGFRMFGADLCKKYIAMAKAAAKTAGKKAKVKPTFTVADAFDFVPRLECDAAFNWYTSFGYADEDEQNMKMVARAFAALKSGGYYALDFLNMPMIMQGFKSSMSTTLHSPQGDIVQTRQCTFDLYKGKMDQHWTWAMPDGKQLTQNSTLRAYMPCDLVSMFKQVGFVDVQLYGGTDGSPLTADSGRCIVVARKPSSNDKLRQSIYEGAILRRAATPASRRLVAHVVAQLDQEFGTEVPHQQLQFSLPGDELYQRMGKVRRAVFASAETRALIHAVMSEHGFIPEANALDSARLRAVTDHGHENPLAAPAYTAHRDTWYANPQAQINWWIPLYDVSEGETFAFFPVYFDKPVANNSAAFDYGKWSENVGFQNTNVGSVGSAGTAAAAVYPSTTEEFSRDVVVPFAAKAGEIILFAASHLHQTCKNVSGRTRLSVDFRTVHVSDHEAGAGAPNVDNQSAGCALADYLRP